MANRDILKEAIADAKAVKETAIANAKIALEEAFTPFLQTTLSTRLAEMDREEMKEDEDNEIKEEYMDEDMYEEKDSMKDEIDLDELLRELEDMEEVINDPKGPGAHGNIAPNSISDTDLMEAEEAEDKEEFDIESMSEEDLKSFIEDVISDMVEAGELEAGHEGMEDEVENEEEEEEVNLEELLRELDYDDLDRSNDDAYGKALNAMNTSPELMYLNATKLAEAVVGRYRQELEKKKRSSSSPREFESEALGYASKMMREAGIKEAVITHLLSVDEDWPMDYISEVNNQLNLLENNKMKKELDEAYKALNKIKSELNEINLLNSKLLYSNKVFKAKNLTESQKVKVLAAFDKATSKKEAQLVYETVMENLNAQTTTKRPMTESVRGMASRVIAGAQNTKQPIIEVNSAFERMQKLAGIKK